MHSPSPVENSQPPRVRHHARPRRVSGLAPPPRERPRHSAFRRLAQGTSNAVGTPSAFAIALGIVLAWAASGPLFHFSDTWQLVINTGTTVVTFLMIFLVQHTQNRETEAIRLQLDELIYAVHAARNEMLAIDDFSDEEIRQLREEFRRIAATRRHPVRATGARRAHADDGREPTPPAGRDPRGRS